MKGVALIKGTALSLACLGLVLPHPAVYAGDPLSKEKAGSATKVPATKDVALGEGGMFRGRVVDAHGIAIDGAPVSVRRSGKVVATTVSDRDGDFRVTNLRGGTYQVVAAQSEGTYRAWAPDTAPPSAAPEVVMVSQPEVIDQGPSGPPLGALAIGALALAGVGAGFAISNSVENNKLQNQISDLQNQVNKIPTSP